MTDPRYVYYPVAYPQPTGNDCASLLRLATVGAVVGGAAAAAGNFRQVRENRMDAGQAMLATGRSAAASGVATAVAAGVAGAVADQGMLRLGLMFATGALAMYGLQQWMGADDVEQP